MASQLCTSEENSRYFIPFVSTIVDPRRSTLHDDNRWLIELPPTCEHSLLVRQTKPVSENRRQSAYGCLMIRCLPASLDFDANYPSVDAHSPPAEVDTADFIAESDSILSGNNVHKVHLQSRQILSKIWTSSEDTNPVTFDNHYFGSEIAKISMTGLHRNATHISILEMEFTSQLSSDLHSVKICIQNPTESKVVMVNCAWNPTNGKLTAVVQNFLSHVKVFYWRSPCIELCLEFYDERVIHSTASDVPHPAFAIVTPQALIMAAVPDDNRILHNLPNVAQPIEDESPDLDTRAALDDRITSRAEITKVACEDNTFRIRLNSALLYSIIKDRSVGKEYPRAFETRVPVESSELTVLVKVLPFKSRSSHISIWAEVTAPSQTSGQVTLEVTAFDPWKEERLGHAVECTEKLKCLDSGNCENARFTLDEVMLHMFAFYRSPDIELYIRIAVS